MRLMLVASVVLALAFAAFVTGPSTAAEEPVWTKGKVTRVKPDAGKVTIRHEEIKNLDMPAMKMVFGVSDPAILEQLKEGEEREFYFVRENGRFIVRQVKE